MDRPYALRCGVVLPNRLALAPLTNGQSLVDGRLGDDEVWFLARRADGGFGLVETCATYVSRDGKAWDGELGVDRDDDLPGLARLAERIRRTGAVAIVQLFHGGVRASSLLSGEPVWSASTWQESGATFEVPRVASETDIVRVIEAFTSAAARCQAAGFDGVELHGAHGYLLSQFLSRTMNPRTDGWGGDLIGRARLMREITRSVRARVGPRFAVGMRLSLEDRGSTRGMDLDENLEVSRWLADDGIDWIHASVWNVAAMTAKRPDQHPIVLLRAVLPKDVAVIACGSVWTAADVRAAMDRGADVVALGRAAILNPDWPKQVRVAGWEPRRAPMTRAELLERGVSPVFASYLKRWKDFVAD